MSDSLAENFLSHRGNLSDRWEQYVGAYETEFARFVASGMPIDLLEIGVENGGSLQIFQSYFPEGSTFTGIDVNPKCAELALGDGIDVFIGDASDPLQIAELLGPKKFDIIIDDGSHKSDDIRSTFDICFKRTKPGGLYIVEDLHCSYYASHGGGYRRPGSAIEFLKSLADAINRDHFEDDAIEVAALNGIDVQLLRELGAQIERVAFYDSLVVIQRAHQLKEGPARRAFGGRVAPVAMPSTIIANLPAHQLRNLILSESAFGSFAPFLLEAVATSREEAGTIRCERDRLLAETATLRVSFERATRDSENVIGQLRSSVAQSQKAVEDSAKVAERFADLCVKHDELLAEASIVKEQFQESGAKLQETSGRLLSLQQQLYESASRTRELERLQRLTELELAQRNDEVRAMREVEQKACAELAAIQTSTIWRASGVIRRLASRISPTARQRIRRFLGKGYRAFGGRMHSPPSRVLPTYQSALAGAAAVVGLPGQHKGEAGPLHEESALRASVLQSDAGPDIYDLWRRDNAKSEIALRHQRRMSLQLADQPTFSILVPLYKTPLDVFDAMVESVRGQTYSKWQLCLALADTGQDSLALKAAALVHAEADPRIELRVLSENGGIGANTNAAFEMAKGEWTALLDHDDILSPEALAKFASAANANPTADFIYSDKDMVDRSGARHYAPLFKPAWSPDIMLNANYLTHFNAMRTARLREVGGWDVATDGAQDWDVFLRVIGNDNKVVHVPDVLYHWRHIETSVSAGGLDAKPYAAMGQLRTIEKYLPIAGWPHAKPRFEGSYIRIDWGKASQLTVSVVIVGGGSNSKLDAALELGAKEVFRTDPSLSLEAAIDEAIDRASGALIILIDAAFVPVDDEWLSEMSQPLANEAIALVGGRVLDPQDRIFDFGILFQNCRAWPAFRGESRDYYGPGGGCGWYRNAAAVSGGALAFRKEFWKRAGGFQHHKSSGRADLAFTLEAKRQSAGRIFLNPFAMFRTSLEPCAFERGADPTGRLSQIIAANLPDGDPYLNRNLNASGDKGGAPSIRLSETQATTIRGHDYSAEARYVANAYDITAADIQRSQKACSQASLAPLKSVIWYLPGFETPFYGGILTILRAAEFMRERHGVAQAFAVLTSEDSEVVRARISKALPDLAKSAKIFTFTDAMNPPNFGKFDAGVCTLWVTAFPLLRSNSVKKKFYFLQDWEPLFYPAGTISALVETTYRFGFHAIANTISLAKSYAVYGSGADHFVPAVDTDVFHARGRQPRAESDPFVLVCYTRPNTPRNCFEALAEALVALKKRYGARIDIVSAGAKWDTEAYGLSGVIRNMGMLPYAETGALYRAADAGICAMATQHPSYLPFELMACGAAVVTNRNHHTEWMLKEEINCLLFEPTRSDIESTVSRLIENPELRDKLANNGLESIANNYSSWDACNEKIYSILKRVSKANLK